MGAAKKMGAGGKRKRAGRPPSPPGTVRRKRVVVRVTDTEFTKLRRLANKQNEPLDTLAYKLLSSALKRRR